MASRGLSEAVEAEEKVWTSGDLRTDQVPATSQASSEYVST